MKQLQGFPAELDDVKWSEVSDILKEEPALAMASMVSMQQGQQPGWTRLALCVKQFVAS